MHNRKNDSRFNEDYYDEALQEISSNYKTLFKKLGKEQKKDFINRWLGNGDRNGFGYIALPLLAICTLVSAITVSVSNVRIPELPLAAEISVSIAPVILILIGFAYFFFRINKASKVVLIMLKKSCLIQGHWGHSNMAPRFFLRCLLDSISNFTSLST